MMVYSIKKSYDQHFLYNFILTKFSFYQHNYPKTVFTPHLLYIKFKASRLISIQHFQLDFTDSFDIFIKINHHLHIRSVFTTLNDHLSCNHCKPKWPFSNLVIVYFSYPFFVCTSKYYILEDNLLSTYLYNFKISINYSFNFKKHIFIAILQEG